MNIETNAKDIQSYMSKVEKKVAYATSNTINDLLFGIRERNLKQFENIFDRPNTKFLKSSFDIKKSTKSSLFGSIMVSDNSKGKGASPLDVLGHQVNPSKRGNRRFESLMKRQGLMGSTMYALPAKDVQSGVLDQYGGISGRFSSWIISYFGAYDKAGFKANMTDKKKSKIHGIGRSKDTGYYRTKADKENGVRTGFKKINGVMYFMSAGREGFGGKRSHLQAGIYSKTGTHGSDIKPVILFFDSKADYKKRFFFEEIADGYVDKYAKELFLKNLNAEIERL